MCEVYYKIQNRIQYQFNIKKQVKSKYGTPQKNQTTGQIQRVVKIKKESNTGMTVMEQRLRTGKICWQDFVLLECVLFIICEQQVCGGEAMFLAFTGGAPSRCGGVLSLVDATIIFESLQTYNFPSKLQNTSFLPDNYLKENLSLIWWLQLCPKDFNFTKKSVDYWCQKPGMQIKAAKCPHKLILVRYY